MLNTDFAPPSHSPPPFLLITLRLFVLACMGRCMRALPLSPLTLCLCCMLRGRGCVCEFVWAGEWDGHGRVLHAGVWKCLHECNMPRRDANLRKCMSMCRIPVNFGEHAFSIASRVAPWPCVVWCGVEWSGVVWRCGVVLCGIAWHGVVGHGVMWCGGMWCRVGWGENDATHLGVMRHNTARRGST